MRLAFAGVLAVLLLAGAPGCGDDYEEIPADETGTKETAETPVPPTPGGKLAFELPTGWTKVGGQKQMRYATLRIPTAEGDTGKAELVIYWQPGGMGTKEMNLARWAGQVAGANGQPMTPADARIDEREINGLKVTTLEIEGTYGDTMMGGAHGSGQMANSRLQCAIVAVPGSDAPYYVKAVGSAKTMRAAQVDYEKFLTSLRLK